jgi:hypothetical protein
MKDVLHKSLRELVPRGKSLALSSVTPSYLVARCEALQDIPLQDYSIEDLRLLVSQQVGLPWLVPLALAHLTQNLFSEGDYYAGDLLASILRLENDYWRAHPAEGKAFKVALAAQLSHADLHNLPRSVLKAAQQRLEYLEELL